jgi:ABC-2 type transport system permease protein
MPKILIQSLKMQQRSFIFWSVGLLFLIGLYIALYPSIKESAAELNAYIEKMPEAFRTAFLAEGADYASPLGYISSEVFSQMLPILFLFYAIGFGSGAIAGEEEKGTLDVVLSTPVRRSRFLLEKVGSLMVGLLYFSIIIIVGLYIGARFVDIDLTWSQLTSATFMLFLLGLNFGAIALFFGSLTGNRGLAISLATAFAVFSFLLNAFYSLAKDLEKVKDFSPFYHYNHTNALIEGITWSSAGLLIGITVILIVLSIVAFARRDLNV